MRRLIAAKSVDTSSAPLRTVPELLRLVRFATSKKFHKPTHCTMSSLFSILDHRYCSSNVVSTITGVIDAIWSDVLTVARLLAVCFSSFGLSGCVCQMAVRMPLPTRTRTFPHCSDTYSRTVHVLVRSSRSSPSGARSVQTGSCAARTGYETLLPPPIGPLPPNCMHLHVRHLFCLQDPFPLLISRIGDMIQQGAETLLNTGLIDPVNDFVENLPWPLNNIGRPIQRVCWQTTYDPDRCTGGPLTITERNQLAQCEDVSQGLENLCFYARVRQICSNDDMITEYTQLFANGYQTVDAVEAEFNAAFGESFDYMDPVCCSHTHTHALPLVSVALNDAQCLTLLADNGQPHARGRSI